MKKILILICLLGAGAFASDPVPSRETLCSQACGTPSSTTIKVKDKNKPSGPEKSIHIDCKCGTHPFNPINGAICKKGEIVTGFDRFCTEASGTLKDHKCFCGDKEIVKPTATSLCENGQIKAKSSQTNLACEK